MYEKISRESAMRRGAKSGATKLAKRILKQCPWCKRRWMEKPSASWRKYCSRACMAAAYIKADHFPCPRCGVKFYRKKSDAHHHCKKCVREILSERNKAFGITPRSVANEHTEEKRVAVLRSKEHRELLSRVFTGVPKKTDALRKYSTRHWKSHDVFFRSPVNKMYHAVNIEAFVHAHQNLFEPEDVEMRYNKKTGLPTDCKASCGLRSLCKKVGTRGSWKGWTLVGMREGRERFDLLGRNFQDSEPY